MPGNFPKPVGKEKIVFQGKILEVVQQDNQVTADKTITFEWARRSPGVRLIILSKDQRKILLTREYRRELSSYDYRLPGGKVFDTLDEYNHFLESGQDIVEPSQAKVVGEAVEETGLVVKSAELIHTSKLGATVEWDLLYFNVTAFEDHPDGQQLEAGEDIAPEWVEVDAAKNMALSGDMSEERSALVLLRFLSKLKM